MMTDEQLAEIKRLANAATPGPWIRVENKAAKFGAQPFGIGIPISVSNQGYRGPEIYADGHDAAFIAAAREAIPELLAEIERLKTSLLDADSEARAADRKMLFAQHDRDELRADIERLRALLELERDDHD